MNVMTVRGEISVVHLGVTQMHEHVLAHVDFEGNDFNLVMDEVDVASEVAVHGRRQPFTAGY